MRCDCSALYRESSRPSSLCDELLAWIYKNEVQLPEEGKKVSYSREQPRQQAPHRALLASEANHTWLHWIVQSHLQALHTGNHCHPCPVTNLNLLHITSSHPLSPSALVSHSSFKCTLRRASPLWGSSLKGLPFEPLESHLWRSNIRLYSLCLCGNSCLPFC